MTKYLYIFVIFFFYTNSNANNKENIINNLKNTRNFNFNLNKILTKKLKKEIAL